MTVEIHVGWDISEWAGGPVAEISVETMECVSEGLDIKKMKELECLMGQDQRRESRYIYFGGIN